jgi:hypothetical protein
MEENQKKSLIRSLESDEKEEKNLRSKILIFFFIFFLI